MTREWEYVGTFSGANICSPMLAAHKRPHWWSPDCIAGTALWRRSLAATFTLTGWIPTRVRFLINFLFFAKCERSPKLWCGPKSPWSSWERRPFEDWSKRQKVDKHISVATSSYMWWLAGLAGFLLYAIFNSLVSPEISLALRDFPSSLVGFRLCFASGSALCVKAVLWPT